MLAELVFMTRFLGLASGEREVVLRADETVRRVEIRRDGERLATIAAPPWRTKVDLGTELGPYELSAVAYDAKGAEVARDSQLVNLARPEAEAGIILARDGQAMTARLMWSHLDGLTPTSAVLELDGKVISREVTSQPVPLGNLTESTVHVLSAELRFPDRTEAQSEIAFGGIFSEEMPAQLTSIAVRQRVEKPPPSPRCFQVRGMDVAPAAVEDGEATVLFVVNGDAPMWAQQETMTQRAASGLPKTEIGVVSPVLREGPGAQFFPTEGVPGSQSVTGAIRRDRRPRGKKEFAHAIAASAMSLLRGERRRAIVYVLGNDPAKDESDLDPVAVRRYLERIGVPFYVWSLTGKRPDLEPTWGPVTDVSSRGKLVAATRALRKDVDTQAIAWLPAAPLDAYRATATADCAYTPLAR